MLLYFSFLSEVGILSSYAFVHPNSRYIGKFFTLFMAGLGYLLHVRYWQAYNTTRYFGNYPIYPADIQRMIENNDARYAFRWLENNYMEISDGLE